MSRYIYQSPRECSRALQLIMEQTDKESETYNALKTAINYLYVIQMDCDKEKEEVEKANAKWMTECARKQHKKEPLAVGDEIIVYDEGVEGGKFKAVVIDIDCDGALWILDQAGANTIINPYDERKREKTGRYFSYVKELIYSMEEGATE